jgi:hypothetical protein
VTANLGIYDGVQRPAVEAFGDQPSIYPAGGTWFSPRHIGSTFVVSQTVIGVQGFTLLAPAVIDRVRFEVTTGAAGTGIVALFDSTPDASPNSLIWNGEADTTASGTKTLLCDIPLRPATYWWGVMGGTATATVRGDAAGSSTPTSALPRRSSANPDNLPRNGAYRATMPSGALRPYPAWTIEVFNGGVANVEFRFAR